MPSSTTSSDARPEAARILLVDDNAAMLARATTVLQTSFVIVGAVQDGASALIAARILRPDVIVLDISMPGLSGFEVARRLRESGSTVPIVFLTVHNDEEFVRAARNAGGLGYVIKPRLAADLAPAVAEVLAHRPFISPGLASSA